MLVPQLFLVLFFIRYELEQTFSCIALLIGLGRRLRLTLQLLEGCSDYMDVVAVILQLLYIFKHILMLVLVVGE